MTNSFQQDGSLWVPKSNTMFKASSLSIDQAVMSQIAKLSCGNVALQSRNLATKEVPDGAAVAIRMWCQVCSEQIGISFDELFGLANAENVLAAEFLQNHTPWFKTHAHSPGQPVSVSPSVTITEDRKLKTVI
jgi:hypothetical protein